MRLAQVSAVSRRVFVVLFALAVTGCGDKTYNYYYGDSDSDGGVNNPSEGGSAHIEDCTVDLSRVAALEACRADDQCPCGTACNNGQCAAECTSNGACADGQRCDTFGRCRAADDTQTVAALSAQAAGVLSVSPSYIEAPGALATVVRVRSDGNAMTNIRVEASSGLEVKCDSAEEFAAACVLPSLTAGVDATLALRTTSAIADETRTLSIFGGSQSATVSVVRSTPDFKATTLAQPISNLAGFLRKNLSFAEAASPKPVGKYVGRARIRDIGSRISPATAIPTSATSGSPPSSTFDVGLTAEVYANPSPGADAGYYTLVMHDPTRTLLPTGEIIGVIKGHSPAGSYDVEFHAQPWVTTTFESGANPLGNDPEYVDVRARYRFGYENDAGIVTVPAVADISTTDVANGRLGFNMLAQYDVSDRQQNAPKTRWAISLTYVGDLPAGATRPSEPTLTTADNPTLPLERYLAPSLWEARVASAIATADAHTVARTLLRRDADMGLCKLSPTSLDNTRLPNATFAGGPDYQTRISEYFYNDFWVRDSATETTVVMFDSNFDLIDVPALGSSRPLTNVTDPTMHPMFADIAARLSASPDYGNVKKIGYNEAVFVPARFASINSPLDANNPNLTVREVPCAYLPDTGQVRLGLTSIFIGGTVLDRCAEISALLDCDVRDTTSGERGSSEFQTVHEFLSDIQTDGDDGPGSFTWRNLNDGSSRRTLTATKVCRLPTTPLMCAEMAGCHDSTGTNTSSFVGDDFRSSSGDASCENADRVFGISADTNASGLTGIGMLSACLADATRLISPPAAGTNLEGVLASSGCASIGSLLFAMGVASESVRESVISPVSTARNERASQIAQRLFVRFADLYGFIARESAQAEKFGQVVRRESLQGSGSLPTPREALTGSLRGWSVLFAPRFQVAMQHLSTNALLTPDYRTLFGDVPENAPTGPRDPLALALLRASTAQLDLAQFIVDRAQIPRDVSAVAIAGETLRYALVAEALAHDLVDRARAANGGADPIWAVRYRATEAGFVAARDRLQSGVDIIVTGQNPLGISEADLPLYFTGGLVSDDGRYFAISDYLVGTTAGSSDNWAPSLIQDAQSRLDVARSAWLERQSRIVENSRDEAARSARVSDVQSIYGDRVVQLCGAPSSLLTSDILTRWQIEQGSAFNPNDCFINQQDPSCTVPAALYANAVTQGDVQKTVCILQHIDAEAPGQARFNGDAFSAAALACPPEQAAIGPCGPGLSCFGCNGGSNVTIPPALFLNIQIDTSVDPAIYTNARTACAAQFPNAPASPPSFTSLGIKPSNSCYRGDIGEQQIAMAGIAKDVDIARSVLNDAQASYDIAIKSCIRRSQADSLKQQMQAAHDSYMHSLRAVKLAADIASNVATGFKDCAAQQASATMPWDKGIAAVGCGSAAAVAAADSISDGMQFAMDEAEAENGRALAAVEAQAVYDICKNDASQYTVGVRTQGLRIQRAMLDLDAANVSLNNLKALAQRAWNDGQSKLAAESTRTLTPLDTDLWLDARIESYLSSMRLAKRVTYLAVRAVEYEYQQSLSARDAVLAAELPEDLDDALRELRTYTAPRTVRGSKPSNKKAVVSLRDAILRMLDQTSFPADDHRLTASQRLALVLTSPQYAMFDASGQYLGQQVPFTMSPFGLGQNNVAALEVYSQDSCAEKLWSVNASILGGGLLRGSAATFTNITVMKANTFFSQWCDGTNRDTIMQAASVLPQRNLFRDPIAGSPDFIDAQLAGADTRFSKALIQPSLNVPREQFEDDAFENGDSSQLAARGLYGEYALFFPAQVLSQRKGATLTDGLDLTHVDDILVRFDYVTVAR